MSIQFNLPTFFVNLAGFILVMVAIGIHNFIIGIIGSILLSATYSDHRNDKVIRIRK